MICRHGLPKNIQETLQPGCFVVYQHGELLHTMMCLLDPGVPVAELPRPRGCGLPGLQVAPGDPRHLRAAAVPLPEHRLLPRAGRDRERLQVLHLPDQQRQVGAESAESDPCRHPAPAQAGGRPGLHAGRGAGDQEAGQGGRGHCEHRGRGRGRPGPSLGGAAAALESHPGVGPLQHHRLPLHRHNFRWDRR